MEGLAQIVGGGAHSQVGPKRVHDLLAMEAIYEAAKIGRSVKVKPA